ncbi:MAG: di-trans,poly-cis-decaprenylcistransferase [Gemmatimonadetes bacterium]|nr:di-trans,poly-cis-decaprenylcistransferase [Gemmatimonadota bacterium]MSR35028.1 di-trans,poly-cis-decaprenylcistransferase [Gemmatimonadota bacterium]
MTQSTFHVAIIMDGNGRWALARGRPREWGHRRGAEAVRRVVEAAPGLGIRTLTLYAFSSDNWLRPAREVTLVMRLLQRYLRRECEELSENGVRLRVVGRRDRLPPEVVAAIDHAESATASRARMTLRLAIDYSSRYALLEAVRTAARAGTSDVQRADVAELLGQAVHSDGPSPDVDLMIRTGGEQRLSDFLLWECAYAELHFTPTMWPDFTAEDLASALQEFAGRERRFGTVALAG